MSLGKKKQVIKHSAAIQISNEVNILQRRAWNVLLANAFDDLETKEKYEIPLKDLIAVLKFDSKNERYLKETLKILNRTQVEWNILNKDGQHEWGAFTLLSQVKIIDGVCIYAYAPDLRERLNNPVMYAKISLSLQNKFHSKHSLALYELFVDYFNIKNEYGETPNISVADFRKLLGLKENEYKQFKHLNLNVIKKALDEINKLSDLFVDVEYTRKGRKVEFIKFRIKKNPKNENIIDLEEIEKKLENQTNQKHLPIPEFEINNQELLDVLINEFGIANGRAVELLKTKDEFYIEEVLDSVRKQIKSGNVKNISAFTVAALEKDYRSKLNQYDQKKVEAKKLQKQIEAEQSFIHNLRQEFDANYHIKTEAAYNKLSDDEKAALIKDFENEIVDTSNKYIQRSYRRGGLESSGIKPFFRSFLAEKLIDPADYNFELYARKQGYQVKQNENGDYQLLK